MSFPIEVFESLSRKDKKACVLNSVLPKPVFRAILVGHSGSGKTNVLKNLLFNPKSCYGEYFDFIYIFCGSVDDLEEYERLGKKHKCSMYDDEKECYIKRRMPIGDKLIIQQTTSNDELNELIHELEHNEALVGKRTLIVLDDMITDTLLKNSVSMNAIDTLFVRGRHFKCSVIISTQKYTALKQNLRMINTTNVFLFNGIPNSNLSLIAKELSGSYEDDEFIQIYKEHTKERYSFIVVNLKNSKDKYIQDRNFFYIGESISP